MEKSSTAFVGMDVHKESIEIAIADAKEARHFGRMRWGCRVGGPRDKEAALGAPASRCSSTRQGPAGSGCIGA